MDYSVFNATYEEIDTGYINYLKSLIGILDVNEEVLDNSIKFYPNPVATILTIDSKTPLKKVEIFSVLGQKVKEIDSDFKSISLENLSKGVYTVRVVTTEGKSMLKILVKK